MKRISVCIAIIMIHSGYSALASSSVDFNKEIEMISAGQFATHLDTLDKTRVTEAAVDFENKYRKPTPTKSLTFFPLRLRAKPAAKKTKVAESTKRAPLNPIANSRPDWIHLYREQVL